MQLVVGIIVGSEDIKSGGIAGDHMCRSTSLSNHM